MIINLCRLQKTCIQIHKKILSEICVYLQFNYLLCSMALRGENSFNQNDSPDAEIVIPDSIYRLGHSDLIGCKNCKVKGDKPFMLNHPKYCIEAATSKSKQNSGGGDTRVK